MGIRITKKDVLWGYTAQFFNIGVNTLILPFVLHLLPPAILGVWYVFLSISAFALMLDFGFQPTFARNVAYVMSGATSLKAEGVDEHAVVLDHPNYGLLKNIIKTMRRFYAYVSLVSLVLMVTVGTWHVIQKTESLPEQGTVLFAWFLFVFYTVLNLFYSYYNALLIGKGQVKEYNQMTIITKSVYLILAVVCLLLGYGIMAIAVANLVSVVVNRVLARYFFYKDGIALQLKEVEVTKERLFPIIWHNAKKIGIGSVGAYFVQKGNVLFLSMFLPLESVAPFGLTTQVITILSGLSPLYLSTHLPEIYKFQINHQLNEIRRVFGESVFVFVVLYVVGAIFILLWGNEILSLIDSKTHLISSFPLLLYLVVQFLESNHGMAALLITTRNEVPYVGASLISGGLIALITLLSLAFTNLGVMGVILSAGFVQLCYNNWKWPAVVCKELHANYIVFFKEGFASLRAFCARYFLVH